MVSKKEQRQHEKRMASFMTAKSTAELKEEVEKVLAKNLPDPESGVLDLFPIKATLYDPSEGDEASMEKMERIEKARKVDENSQRY
jgi:hypothetical protein